MAWLVRGALVAAVLGLMAPSSALAGGLFYAGAGTKSLGRGAAYHVRADGPIALMYNPARLADLRGAQLQADFNLALPEACMEGGATASDDDSRRIGTYLQNYDRPGGEAIPTGDSTRYGVIPVATSQAEERSWAGTTRPKVCGETTLLPIPNIAFTYNLADKIGRGAGMYGLTIGFGLITPAAVPATRWGNKDGSVRAAGHATQEELDEAIANDRRLPPGVRPDVVCDPSQEDCSMFCDPLAPPSEAGDCQTQYYCDPRVFDCDSLPSPTRHLLVEQAPIGVPLALGVGYRPLPWLAIGGTFTYQLLAVKTTAYGPETPPEQPEKELRLETALTDYFVPAVNGSVLASPYDGLDLMGYFRWNAKIEGTAKMTVIASDHAILPPLDEDGNYDPAADIPEAIEARRQGKLPVRSEIPKSEKVITSLPQPWEIGGGIRYALLRRTSADPARPEHNDPMESEVFDIEANFIYEHNSSVDSILLTTSGNTQIRTFGGYDINDTNYAGIPPTTPNTLPLLPTQTIPRNWKDQYVVRVGGDYNVVPNVLALRAGANFETSGVRVPYASVDAIPAQRVGVHVGFTYRVGKFDLSLAYGHVFQQTLNVLPNPDEIAPEDDETGQRAQLRANSPDPNAFIANQGRYTVKWDLLSFGITQRF